MGIYKRAPYWWKKYEIDPVTKVAPRPPASTKIYIDGGSKAQSAQNKADALLQFQKDCIDIRQGILKPIAHSKPAIRFRDYAPIWERTHSVHHRSHETETSVLGKLVSGLVPSLDGVAPARPLGDYFLHELTTAVIARWRTERCRTVKAITADRNVGMLRVMLKHATEYLDSNPLFGIDKLGNKNWEKLDHEETETRWFSVDEFNAFVAALERADVIYGIPRAEGLALTYAALETLLRRGSLLRLTWPYDRGTHFVPLNAKVKIRRSPITSNLRYYLDALPRDTPGRRIFASCWAQARSEEPKRQLRSARAVVWRWFAAACKLADIPCGRANHGVTFHSFRHTGATWLLKAGKNPRAVMTLGGWTKADVFLKTYCHTDDAEVDATAESLFHNRPRLRLVVKQ